MRLFWQAKEIQNLFGLMRLAECGMWEKDITTTTATVHLSFYLWPECIIVSAFPLAKAKEEKLVSWQRFPRNVPVYISTCCALNERNSCKPLSHEMKVNVKGNGTSASLLRHFFLNRWARKRRFICFISLMDFGRHSRLKKHFCPPPLQKRQQQLEQHSLWVCRNFVWLIKTLGLLWF